MEFDALRAVSILRNLTDEELSAFGQLLDVREVKKGESIIKEGEEVTHFQIICDGTVHVRRLAQKRQVLMGRLGVGAFFGEINLFDPGLATASVVAMSTVRVAVLSYEVFRAFMESNPETGYKIVSGMMTEMSRRLRTTSARLINSLYWQQESSGVGPGPSEGGRPTA